MYCFAILLRNLPRPARLPTGKRLGNDSPGQCENEGGRVNFQSPAPKRIWGRASSLCFFIPVTWIKNQCIAPQYCFVICPYGQCCTRSSAKILGGEKNSGHQLQREYRAGRVRSAFFIPVTWIKNQCIASQYCFVICQDLQGFPQGSVLAMIHQASAKMKVVE